MIFFITVLRAIAACLITNSHYTGIYPIDAIANGGFVGNAIFCAVSGYCLYSVKGNFLQWYSKRLIRCYLPLWVITAVYLLLGAYTLTHHGLVWWFLYPTNYHFIASIVILYIPYYLILKWEPLRSRLPWVMAAIALVSLIIFLIRGWSSYYVDDVRSLHYRIVLLECMLLGAWMRQNDHRFRDRFSWWYAPLAIFLFGFYMVYKFLLAKLVVLLPLQLLSPVAMVVMTYWIFRTFQGLDTKLSRLPKPVNVCIEYIAKLTLEIYVVQNVLIDRIRPLFGFPVNWLVLTASILAVATLLHFGCEALRKLPKMIHPSK